jgi:hypothetical protein
MKFVNNELILLLENWFDYICENFEVLENGSYQNLRIRPKYTFK